MKITILKDCELWFMDKELEVREFKAGDTIEGIVEYEGERDDRYALIHADGGNYVDVSTKLFVEFEKTKTSTKKLKSKGKKGKPPKDKTQFLEILNSI